MLKRRHLAAYLVLAWVGALGWLVVREYQPGPGAEDTAPSRVQLPPTTTFYALRAGAEQVGLASITTDTLPDGIRVTTRTDVDVPLPMVPRRLLAVTEALYDQRLRLRSFTTTASGEAGQLTLVAAVVAESVLSVVVSGRGMTTSDSVVLAIPAGVLLPDAVLLALAARGELKAGARTTAQVLDPVELTVRPWEILVGADSTFVVPDSAVLDSVSGAWAPAGQDTIRATQVSWMEYGLPVRTWIDHRGTVIERTTPLGLEHRRAPFEIVNSGYVRRRPRSVQAAPLEVSATVALREGPSRISLGPVDLRAVAPMLTTPWQFMVDGGLQTRDGGPIRRRPRGRLPDSIPMADYQPPASARITVEALRIVAGDTTNPSAAVSRLAAWIGSAVVAGPPTVGDVERTLLRRRGDSSDRAELLVAMARSLGIPARSVSGLLISGGRFRYRAWAEVWLDGWIPVDPTLSQFPVDAGHVRLLTHATARPAAIVSLVGAVRPVSITPKTAP